MSEQGPRFEALTAKVPTFGELEPGTRFRWREKEYQVGKNRAMDGTREGWSLTDAIPVYLAPDKVPDAILTNPDGTPYTGGKVDPDALPDGWYALVPDGDTIGPVVYRKIAGRWTMVNDQGSACGPASGCRPTHRIHWQ